MDTHKRKIRALVITSMQNAVHGPRRNSQESHHRDLFSLIIRLTVWKSVLIYNAYHFTISCYQNMESKTHYYYSSWKKFLGKKSMFQEEVCNIGNLIEKSSLIQSTFTCISTSFHSQLHCNNIYTEVPSSYTNSCERNLNV